MNDQVKLSIEYPNGVTDNAVLATRVGENLYRLDLDPLSSMMAESDEELELLPNFGDTIAVERVAPDLFRFIRVAERASLERHEFLAPDTQELEAILSRVVEEGGHWERVFGGLLVVCVPKSSDYDFGGAVERMSSDA
ncbi:MAG: hypothetical protein V3W41_05035 [Planctomycetota bacterium]